jgi:acyl-CoA synthetase (AMP-forming)/AMP-acid ligase II
MECTAFGVPDERLGEEIALMVFLKKGEIKATIPDMLASVAGTLANFKTPQARHVFIIDNPLPRGATGKIQKAQVRKDAAALLALLCSKSKL